MASKQIGQTICLRMHLSAQVSNKLHFQFHAWDGGGATRQP